MPLPLPKTRAEIDAIQRVRRIAAVKNALRAPFHRERLKGIDPEQVNDPAVWQRIPLLTKDALRALSFERYMAEFCLAERRDTAEYWRSGGVTGEPLFYPRTYADLPYCMLGFSRTFACVGVGPGDTCHMALPLGVHPAGHMWARSGEQIGVGMLWAGAGASTPSAMQLSLIQRLEPTVLLTMPSYALHLANLAEAQGLDLARCSVQKVMCTAEPLSLAKREKLGRMWGAGVYDCFGMTEASMMGAESGSSDGYHIWTDLFHIEVLDPETQAPVPEGAQGMLVVTPLWSFTGTPFLRWSSGDIVTYRAAGGTGPFAVFPMVRHAHRTAGFFKVRGINLNHAEFEDFMFQAREVADFKAELLNNGGLDDFVLSIEVGRGSDGPLVCARIAEQAKARFELAPKVVLLERGTLAREFEGAVKAPRFADRR